jgi:rare lipoprotein A
MSRTDHATIERSAAASPAMPALSVTTLALLLAACLLAGCASLHGPGGAAIYQRGEAAYYAARFDGRRTASGERFDSRRLTAAHRSLPMGSRVKVTNENNGRTVTVRINDRGPYSRGRIIDLSRAAAARLDMVRNGSRR